MDKNLIESAGLNLLYVHDHYDALASNDLSGLGDQFGIAIAAELIATFSTPQADDSSTCSTVFDARVAQRHPAFGGQILMST